MAHRGSTSGSVAGGTGPGSRVFKKALLGGTKAWRYEVRMEPFLSFLSRVMKASHACD